jgi:SAM-dependent methyltransferase
LDGIDDGVVTGWAAQADAATPVDLEILVDGVRAGQVTARIFREDLRAAGIGDGRHGFEFTIPDDVRARGTYQVSVRDARSQTELEQSPREVDEHSASPLAGRSLRRFLGDNYLRGDGLEIGPLHRPWPVPADCRMTYTDSFSTEALRTLWSPEVDGYQIIPIDVVTDATTLSAFTEAHFDFVIASHVIEHLENPVAGIAAGLRVLKPGGVLLLALPDRRHTFDRSRPPTSIEHVLRDYCGDCQRGRRQHYEEWVGLVEHLKGEALATRVSALEAQLYPIHFHVWTPLEFTALLAELHGLLPIRFDVELFTSNGPEGLWVLRKAPR